MKTVLLALALAGAAVAHAAPQERPQDRWNLADMYASTQAWDADAAKVEGQLKEIGGCRGQLGQSAARFKQCLDLEYDALKTTYRLYTYASENAAQDTG